MTTINLLKPKWVAFGMLLPMDKLKCGINQLALHAATRRWIWWRTVELERKG